MNALSAMDDEEFDGLLNDAFALDLGLNKQLLESSLYEYVKAAWHLVEPSQSFIECWHIKKMCRALEDCYYRRPWSRRVILNVPPGTAKSLIVNVLFPTWVWAKNARKRFLFASYGSHLSMRDNLRARQILESPWFQERWPLQLAEDQNAKGRYNTADKGWRIATSVNGVGTGEHPDFIIIDDPTSAQEAESETERTNANNWFDRTMSTRLGRNPIVIIIMQRLHKDDLSGHLLRRGGWRHIRWPMRFEKCTCPKKDEPLLHEELCPLHKADPEWIPDELDERTEAGELLAPKLFPEEKVKELELNLGAYGSAGQLQQRPSPIGGKVFQREWFKFVDVCPDVALMRLARGWDTAASEGKGDSTASIKIGELFEYQVIPASNAHQKQRRELKSTGTYYLMDPLNEKFGPAGVDALIKSTAISDGKTVAQREEKEGGSAGKTVIDARTKTLAGYNYAGVPISGSKLTRAKPFRAQCEAGNVYLVGSPAKWEAYISELCDFPTGSHDDYVDASSCAFNSVLLEEPPKKAKITW